MEEIMDTMRVGLENELDVQEIIYSCLQQLPLMKTERRGVSQDGLTPRQLALEVIYAIATAFDSSIEAIFNQIVLVISDTLQSPLTMIHQFDNGQTGCNAQVFRGVLSPVMHEHPCCACWAHKAKRDGRFGSNTCTDPAEMACSSAPALGSCMSVPIHNGNGKVFGAVCVFDTGSRQFSKDEIHFAEILARYVAHVLLRKGLEAHLRRSHEIEIIGQLTSGIAHEVRNPIHGLRAVTEALFQDIGARPESDIYMKHIFKQVEKLSILMNDLLALTQPIRDESLPVVSVSALVSEAYTLWRQSVPETVRKVRLSLPPGLKNQKIKADNDRLEQAFVNVLQNAHRRTPQELDLGLCVSSVNDGRLRIRVIDAGKDIPTENLSRIFEPFFATKNVCFGLGLSIARRIVESHGGTVSIFTNDPIPGMTVEIDLPLVEEPAVC